MLLRRLARIQYALLTTLTIAYISSIGIEFYLVSQIRPKIDYALSKSNYKMPTTLVVHRALVRHVRQVTWFFGISCLIGLYIFVIKSHRLMRFLINAEKRAIESSKLKSEFVANISHEIRTPISLIMGFAEIQKLDGIEHSTEILDAADQLMIIVTDLLNFSKFELGTPRIKKESFDVQVLLKSALRDVQENDDVTKELVFLDNYKGTKLLGDVGKIRQVLMNLLINAVKFTEVGTITLSCAYDEDLLKFWVTDTGIGVEPENQADLFTPFLQVDGSTTRKYGGTGLGLAICHKLVTLMGGQIGMFSEGHNRGSTFWFLIPLEFDNAN